MPLIISTQLWRLTQYQPMGKATNGSMISIGDHRWSYHKKITCLSKLWCLKSKDFLVNSNVAASPIFRFTSDSHDRNLDFDSKMLSHLRLMASGKKLESFSKALWREMNRLPHLWQGTPDFRKPLRFQKSFDFGDHDSWSQKVSQRMEAAEMCDHFCDGSRGMDDFCWVEVQSKLTYHKIASFFGFFRWDSKFMSKFRQFLEVNQKIGWKPDFPAKFEDFFSFQKMVTTWCFSGPTIGGGCDLDLLCHVPRNSFFFGTWYYHRQVFSASLFPMTDLWQRLHVVKVSKG